MPEPSEYQDEAKWMEVCVPKLMGEGKDNDQAVAACMSMWKDKGKEKEYQSGFTFTELSGEFETVKAIDGLAACDDHAYTAMSGSDVFVKTDELESYLKNSDEILLSTLSAETGKIVGLPIDLDKHDHGGGAGKIIGFEFDKTRNIIKFIINWTEKGIKQVKDNLGSYFSPSIDPERKIIIGGSLTNYPAIRNNKGWMLLRPVEFSQQIKEIDMTKTLEEVMIEMEALKTQVAELSKPAPIIVKEPDDSVTPEMAEFIANTDGAEELGRQAQEIAQRQVKDSQRKEHVKKFASRVVGGTPDKPFSIPVPSRAIVAALLSMPDKQRIFMEDLIMKMYEGAIDFAERGISGSDFIQGKIVPAEYHDAIKIWVDSGKTAGSWFKNVMPELGDAKDYNLKEFAAQKEE